MSAKGQPRHLWTHEEDAMLISLYDTQPASEIAKAMGMTRGAIKNRVNKLGITKGHNCGCFDKGMMPWNKGQHFVAGGRAAETQFKPGQKPHNWNPIGHERITKDGYLQRKLTDTGITRRDYVMVHHIVWREAGNDIPTGSALIFIDGNRKNFALSNLALITRANLMRRNSVHNYGPEIAAIAQLQGAIQRQINRRARAEA